ncbi:GAF domain-containing protein [Piscinibacter sakaiensis]|uniref:GAF domain-containing protein n=1 Tax=Piscinibacter sakaiensis TaxID=1547922 RepID=UPI003AAB81CD
MNSFIKACEVWIPSKDGSMLEFSAGLFGAASGFAAVAQAMCFGRGEGLPGRAWDEGRPIMLKQLDGSYFRRAAAAEAAGIRSAVAMPIFLRDDLSAVLVFFCGATGSAAGALELWHNDPRVSTDMKLVDGHFGDGSEALEALSRDAYLPRGTGLAGIAWQRGAAVLIDDLGQSNQFLRSDSTAEAGIKRGLAIPCCTTGNHHHVLNFLSASRTPIAQRIESWAPAGEGAGLQRVFGFSEASGALPTGDEGPTIALDAGAVATAWDSGVPQVVNGGADGDGDGSSLLAIPVIADGRVAEVVVLYFD